MRRSRASRNAASVSPGTASDRPASHAASPSRRPPVRCAEAHRSAPQGRELRRGAAARRDRLGAPGREQARQGPWCVGTWTPPAHGEPPRPSRRPPARTPAAAETGPGAGRSTGPSGRSRSRDSARAPSRSWRRRGRTASSGEHRRQPRASRRPPPPDRRPRLASACACSNVLRPSSSSEKISLHPDEERAKQSVSESPRSSASSSARRLHSRAVPKSAASRSRNASTAYAKASSQLGGSCSRIATPSAPSLLASGPRPGHQRMSARSISALPCLSRSPTSP